jgi:hypothetical protein
MIGPPTSHVLEYTILGDYAISDHLPVKLSLEIQPDSSTSSHFKMNNFYLIDKWVLNQLTSHWHTCTHTFGFFGKLRRVENRIRRCTYSILKKNK